MINDASPFLHRAPNVVGTFFEVHRWDALHDKEGFSLRKIVLRITFSLGTIGKRRSTERASREKKRYSMGRQRYTAQYMDENQLRATPTKFGGTRRLLRQVWGGGTTETRCVYFKSRGQKKQKPIMQILHHHALHSTNSASCIVEMHSRAYASEDKQRL